ncbi:helix-turn-helix transcriptional regulator [Paraburkholderia phytofirmans]|uniref:helix-turn-helix transcriptional regulator n=1 Tax=Paraburkholderia phytofirmans TaxID=261302 RepID=UPI0038B6EE54
MNTADDGPRARPDLASLPDDALLRIDGVLAIVGLSRSAWYAGIRRGDFPAGIALTKRSHVWRADEIRRVIAARD